MARTEIETRGELEKALRGYRQANVLCAGVELGVFEALANKPLDTAGVARKIKASRRGTEILLNALAAVGLLRKSGETFRLASVAERHLTADAPESLVYSIKHSANVQRSWIDLPFSVRTGEPVPRKPGKDGKPDPERHRSFILAMHDGARGAADDLAAALDLSRVSRVLDVGGGPGSFLFAMIRKNPKIQGAVFDLPNTIRITREVIAANGMEASVGTIEGDFLADDFGDGYDLILMSSIIHINSPAENKKLARKAFKALNPGGRLVIRDHMLEDSKTEPLDGALFSVNMLVNTSRGASYSKSEIRSWLAAAGFTGMKYTDVPPRSAVMVGKKPIKKNN
ncbi:MAG: methyltransferase [bacterium]